MTATTADPASPTPPAPIIQSPLSAQQTIPWLGLIAVLLGTFISTLNGRLSTFGLADIRGTVHAGFDEGAWITSAQTAAQMLVTPIAVWVGSLYGPRRILLVAALGFACTSSLTPFAEGMPTLLMLQFLGGLASGCFIPLTLSFVLRNIPLRLWAYGIAVYALNLELSLNISASLEAWYVENFSWHWIFWQNVPLALAMAACLYFGVPSGRPPPARIKGDAFGLVSSATGLALIYVALDQGNRLDWENSGVIWGLSLAGITMLVAFVAHALSTPYPWLDLKAAFRWPLPALMILIALLRLTILSTAYLIPQYLGAVRGFRSLQVGDTLLWIAVPQLVICPLAALTLRWVDSRTVAAAGLILVGIACILVANGLTPLWGSDQFLVSQLLQAVGQSLALSGIVFTGVLNLRPEDALTFGAMLQVARLFGGEVGQAFVATAVRIREQRASNLIGQHLRIGDADVQHRLQIYGRIIMRTAHQAGPAPALLGGVVRSLATTQSVIDTFVATAVAAASGLLVLIVLPSPPITPASHRPLFSRKKTK